MTSKFSTMITHLRKQKGISQKAAAADLGVSQSLLSHYEKGIRECGNDFVVKAADYYGVSCDYILGRQQAEDNSAQNCIPAEQAEHVLATAFRAYGVVLDKIKVTDPTYYNRLCSFMTLSVYRGLTAGIHAGYIPSSWCQSANSSDPVFFESALAAVSDGLLAPVKNGIEMSSEPAPQSVKAICEKSESCIKYFLQQLNDNI